MEVKKIKTVITAIGNPQLNNKLKQINKFKIICNDIPYQDGIFEILEINKDIEFLIISELLPGELGIEELIEKIKNNYFYIKIILIIEEVKEKKEKIFIKKGAYKVLKNNSELNNIINIFNDEEKIEKNNEEIIKEIEEIKKYIKNNKIEKNNLLFKIKNNKIINLLKKQKNKKFKKIINNYFNKIIINKKIIKNKIEEENNIKNNFIKNNKKIIISILGNNGSGKSVVTVMISKLLKKYYKKILIIDFDILNNSIHTILGVKKYSEKTEKILKNNNKINNLEKININNLVIKINKKIDLISGINIIFNNNKKIDEKIIKNILFDLSEKYDAIIIDTTSECFFDFTKELITLSDKCLFLTEANLLEISKSKRLLDIYYNNWKIEKNKINIIFNKFNNYCIDVNLLKNIFSDYNILGKIKLKNNYNYFLNNNFKIININKNINKNIKNNYEKLLNKI